MTDDPNGEMHYMDISLPMKLIAMVEEDERNQGKEEPYELRPLEDNRTGPKREQ
jgi:hypothetical protein